MGKGKGHQSGGFGSKSQSAAFAQEMRHETGEMKSLSRQQQQSKSKSKQQQSSSSSRPRFAGLTQLKGMLRERQSQEAYALVERRRRAGFLPRRDAQPIPGAEPMVSHPPGWMLSYDGNSSNELKEPNNDNIMEGNVKVESLQKKCVEVMGRYMREYLDALGREELHAAFALLPSETLATLSVVISNTFGCDNDLAILLGKHAHIERLCVRASQTNDDQETLTDEALMELVPRLPCRSVHESWEDFDTTANNNNANANNSSMVDVMQLEGCNVKLKRLELLDCRSISADVLILLLRKCSCITHLSLAGSLNGEEDGVKVLRALPELLPALQVLDVTRCAWMTTSLLDWFVQQWYHVYPNNQNQKPPVVHCQGSYCSTTGPYLGHDW